MVSFLRVNHIKNCKQLTRSSLFRQVKHTTTASPRLYSTEEEIEREEMEFDVVIVGGGPAGLGSAIRLKQLNPDLEVCLLEKGGEIGAHLLSGACMEPHALDELIPEWKEKGAPVTQKALYDSMKFLTEKGAYPLPVIPQMHNEGNYIISLGELCQWMAEQAEELGVEIFPGFAASELVFNDKKDQILGVQTGDAGVGTDGKPTDMFEPGMKLLAKQTIFAEGCRGHLTKQLTKHFDLYKDCKDKPTYALGVKEIWEVDNEHFKAGSIMHSIGWPLDPSTYGGSFMYHLKENQINVGFVVSLDYANPTISVFEELQRFKTHPEIKKYFKNGKLISYGARTLNEGGYTSLPKLTFPGGALVGDTAGFLNVPKIKGIHSNMKSGMLGAEAVYEAIEAEESEAVAFDDKFKNSWLHDELYKERNIRNYFYKGLYAGAIMSGLDSLILRGHAPWTIGREGEDHEHTKPLDQVTPIEYPKHDGVLTFDKLTALNLSGTFHEEDQPCHLKLTDEDSPINLNLAKFGEKSMNFCPAGVYEFVTDEETGKKRFQINSQNCLHCKACDIKDMGQNINWVSPQGGEGPSYASM